MAYDPAMQDADMNPRQRDIYTVSRLNREVRALLEGSFPLLWVEGEISNLARPASGHLYFSLKDGDCQVRCAMFRSRNMLLNFRPENGAQVLLRARVGLYEGRGDFQLLIESMQPAGNGRLQLEFEQLKRRLASEGLFDEADKQPLPALPRRIGVITSPSGAAIRDILSVIRRRYPALGIIIYPTPVQGDGAACAIRASLDTAIRRGECDVLILARGGGSLEDLWAFNDEALARAIHACPIPLVTGIGHEIDFTIADFVADHRAATPSAAAELITPDGEQLRLRIKELHRRLTAGTEARLRQWHQTLDWYSRRLVDPRTRLQQLTQRCDELQQRLVLAANACLQRQASHIGSLRATLERHNPGSRIATRQVHIHNLGLRLASGMQRRLDRQQARLAVLMRALDTISPLATLGRGYAIVTALPEGRIVREAASLSPGDAIRTRLARGQLICEVKETHDG